MIATGHICFSASTFRGTQGYPIWTHAQMIWVNYNDLTTTSLEIMVNKGNHPQMALIQVSEIL